ncbi:MAG: leucyl aminopeptidase family protein [Pseudomonadota bacterium]
MFCTSSDKTFPIHLLTEDELSGWLARSSAEVQAWVQANGFKSKAGTTLLLPSAKGGVDAVLCGRRFDDKLWALSHLPSMLPPGDYYLAGNWSTTEQELFSLGWGLGHYRFDRYKPSPGQAVNLLVPEENLGRIQAFVDATVLVRDLVNTPANDLGPAELADVAIAMGDRFKADVQVIQGDDLERDFPAIHVVGKASSRAPRLIRLQWGDDDAPPLALVGKGVIFDSGGLDIKPGVGMVLMKKDMGGAAHVLGLAQLIMTLGLNVNLRVYIPAVENSISGNAYRPSDVIRTRRGTTVEIGNTDAEGRVVLSDALTLACEEGALHVIDFATLTGAARIALGEDLPPLYARDQAQARAIQDRSFELQDPLWHMPLYEGYREQIKPGIADLSNTGSSKFGGSLTAALFLDHFVDAELDWVHLDVYAWNLSNRPGRPAGGEAQGLRAIFDWLEEAYGHG